MYYKQDNISSVSCVGGTCFGFCQVGASRGGRSIPGFDFVTEFLFPNTSNVYIATFSQTTPKLFLAISLLTTGPSVNKRQGVPKKTFTSSVSMSGTETYIRAAQTYANTPVWTSEREHA
jgi:hypothetical protein